MPHAKTIQGLANLLEHIKTAGGMGLFLTALLSSYDKKNFIPSLISKHMLTAIFAQTVTVNLYFSRVYALLTVTSRYTDSLLFCRQFRK